MTNNKEQNTQKLYQALWNSADILRSKMDASDYKSYLLGIIFYKYLSDRMLYFAADALDEKFDSLQDAQRIYQEAYNDAEVSEDLLGVLKRQLSYYIVPNLTFTALVNDINNNEFQLETLRQAFNNIEQADSIFENLFEDIDLYSKKLGANNQKQNQVISSIMKEIDVLDVAGHQGDVLGDAYEYLIGQFASDSGKKAGEFYTPQPVAKLMTQIAIHGKEDKKGLTLYDPTIGSGSLLLNAKKYSRQAGTISYYGQELNTTTYNLARMNMMMHGVPVANQHLRNGDTLDQDWPTDEPTDFDAVLMNPPYSAKWSANTGFLSDARFSSYGILAPKSKADFAFLLHGLYHLKQNGGVMAIVLPHGVLFRGNSEGKIRQRLLEEGSIDTVIGMPANIFYNTSIPTTVIILRKDRKTRDVLFIDASQEFVKGKNQNMMDNHHIQKILDTYISRESIDKFSYLASFEEIQENDFNLNIPRYVDTFEEEEVKPFSEIIVEINQTNNEIETTKKELFSMLDQLVGTNEEEDKALREFIEQIKR
ncbi:MAG: type I restriction-modification system subunit M [Erysipelothrix sp.]|nr:type I restriction-modification system subunit M [Erysipelothrix sp.]